MCGCNHDDPSRTRGGALAVLSVPSSSSMRRRSRSPSPSSPPASPSSFSSITSTSSTDLVFHTPGVPKARYATHIRLSSEDVLSVRDGRLRVVIHTTGDMSSPNDDNNDNNALYQFDMAMDSSSPSDLDDTFVEMKLPEQVAIEVGGLGVIGRRVSVLVSTRDGGGWEDVIGEGIVGFNF